MLAHVNRGAMLKIASQTSKAAAKNAVVKELNGIHMEADARRSMVTLTATNSELAIRASMPALVEESGSAVIHAPLLTELLSKLPEENVDFELRTPTLLSVHSGMCEFELNVLAGEKYPMPELPFPDDMVSVTGLRSLARNIGFAISTEETQPLLRCVRLTLGPDGLKAMGSNGFCIMEAEGDRNCKGETQLLIPAYALKTLAAISDDKDVYDMGLAGKSLVFWSGTLMFSARLMQGAYPQAERVLDQFQASYTVNVDAEALARAILGVASMCDDMHRIRFSFGEHELIVSAVTENGGAEIPVKALVLNAPGKSFYYNYIKLLDYLRLATGKINLEFSSQGILVIRPGKTRYMQSPMRPPKAEEAGRQAA